MASNESTLKDLIHPSYNEHLKSHNAVTFKLVKTVSDFTQQLGQMYEQHAEEMQMLVSNFRKRNNELRKERPACPSSLFHTWEALLQEVEIDSQAMGDIASILGRQVSRPMLERSFYRKIQSRKVFTHRESYETIIAKTEEKLAKTRQEYKNAYLSYLTNPTTESLSAYFNAHNAYVQQLHATNGMMEEFGNTTLPSLLQAVPKFIHTVEECPPIICQPNLIPVLDKYDYYGTKNCPTYSCYPQPMPDAVCNITGRTFNTVDDTEFKYDICNHVIARDIELEEWEVSLKKNCSQICSRDLVIRHDDHEFVSCIIAHELEDIYTDLCSTVTDAVIQGAEVISSRASEQTKRYESLATQCRSVSGPLDLSHLARSVPTPAGRGLLTRRIYVPPQPPPPPDGLDGDIANGIPNNDNVPPPLRDELVVDQLSAVQIKPSHDVLKKESEDLRAQIRQIQEALDTLLRIQQRSAEASLFAKTNELQEDVSMKKFDLRVAQIHLSAINAQIGLILVDIIKGLGMPEQWQSVWDFIFILKKKELFTHKLEGDTGAGRERKMSASSTASMKNKWLKAFKSLKTPPPEEPKKNGSAATKELLKGDPDAHNFQENTYKKITPCDVCSQILRGHTRQGLKCRICKMNVHLDCVKEAQKCQTKAKLLRRQKSTSEIETRIPDMNADDEKCPPDEVDQIYQVLKQATEISNSKPRVSIEAPGITVDRSAGSNPGSSGGSGQSLNKSVRAGLTPQPSRAPGPNLAVVNPAPCSTSSAPHSPRRQKLNLRMKSLSLDSPESTEHAQRRQRHGANAASDPHSNHSSSSKIQFVASTVPPKSLPNQPIRKDLKTQSTPSSPVHNRRLLSAKNIRMSSVELPDDNEKSPSSASTSPCPSPVGKKSNRLLPTNLYVVLYNFKARHQDELDLKAGYKVTVIETSDPDWWKGKCFGKVGFFPSKYVSKLSSGEKPLQVTHNLQVSDGDNGLMLLRDQIVIQIGDEVDGMVMIRSGDNRQGVCPVKFLQEV